MNDGTFSFLISSIYNFKKTKPYFDETSDIYHAYALPQRNQSLYLFIIENADTTDKYGTFILYNHIVRIFFDR